jgi:hypothetical protein
MDQENKTTQPENENTQVTETAIDVSQALQEAHKRIVELEKERDDALAKADKAEMHNLQSFRRAEILKKALLAVTESKEMKMGDVYELLLESNSFDLDQLLFYLSK